MTPKPATDPTPTGTQYFQVTEPDDLETIWAPDLEPEKSPSELLWDDSNFGEDAEPELGGLFSVTPPADNPKQWRRVDLVVDSGAFR